MPCCRGRRFEGVFRRDDRRDLSRFLSDMEERIKRLEDTASRRVLPAGYTFTTNNDGDLLIRRLSDNQTVTVFNA